MTLGKAQKSRGRQARSHASRVARLYSIPALLKGREFVGRFDIGGAEYDFAYAPRKAEVVDGKLQLQGALSVTSRGGREYSRESVRATLASIQGGLGTSPARRQVLTAMTQTGTFATSGQQQQVAGDTDKPVEKPADQAEQTRPAKPPEVESTTYLSFTGVMYFHFEPLDARSLGLKADLSRVQLNARLAPTDQTASELQGAYSSVIDSLYEENVDKQLAADLIAALNRLLSAS